MAKLKCIGLNRNRLAIIAQLPNLCYVNKCFFLNIYVGRCGNHQVYN